MRQDTRLYWHVLVCNRRKHPGPRMQEHPIQPISGHPGPPLPATPPANPSLPHSSQPQAANQRRVPAIPYGRAPHLALSRLIAHIDWRFCPFNPRTSSLFFFFFLSASSSSYSFSSSRLCLFRLYSSITSVVFDLAVVWSVHCISPIHSFLLLLSPQY